MLKNKGNIEIAEVVAEAEAEAEAEDEAEVEAEVAVEIVIAVRREENVRDMVVIVVAL